MASSRKTLCSPSLAFGRKKGDCVRTILNIGGGNPSLSERSARRVEAQFFARRGITHAPHSIRPSLGGSAHVERHIAVVLVGFWALCWDLKQKMKPSRSPLGAVFQRLDRFCLGTTSGDGSGFTSPEGLRLKSSNLPTKRQCV